MSKLQEIEPLKKKLVVRNGKMPDMEPTSGKCPAGLPSKVRVTCKFYLEIFTLCHDLRLQKLSFEVHSSSLRTDFFRSLPHSKIVENIHNASEEAMFRIPLKTKAFHLLFSVPLNKIFKQIVHNFFACR